MGNFSNYGVKLHTTGMASAMLLGGVTNLAHNLNNELLSPDTGHAYRDPQSLVGQKPQIDFSTTCLADVLTNVGVTGEEIDSDGTHSGFVAYMQKHDPATAGGRSAAANMSLTFSDGHLLIESIDAGGVGSLVESRLRAHGITPNGSTSPLTVACDVTLPSGLTVARYGLGKPHVLGTLIEKIVSMNIAYGAQANMPADAATIWPSEFDPSEFDLVATIVCRHPELLGTVPETGDYTDNDTVLRFVRRVSAGSQVATASNGAFAAFTDSVHISGAVNALVHIDQHYSASGKATGLTQITLAMNTPDGGSTAPIVWNPATTYTESLT